MKNSFWFILLLVIGCVISGIVGYKIHNPAITTETTIETDTITIVDTVYIDKPIPKYITNLQERIDTIIQVDSIEVPISLPIVEKTYQDSIYKAVVKGVEIDRFPSLESLEIYRNREVITNTITVQQHQSKWGFQLGVGIGYGISPNGRLEPNFGIHIGYGFRLK